MRLVSVLAGMFVSVIFATAQITTSSIGGRISDEKGESIVGAVVIAVHQPSGTQYYSSSNNEGRYFIGGMRSGGPYTVEVSNLGYQSVKCTDINLNLAESFIYDATLKDKTEELAEAVVVSNSTKFTTDRSGSMTNISNREILALPNISRSMTEIAKISPYGGNGMSFAGADGRTANFTVDGADFNNNFGLSQDLPGGGNPISIDAIEAVQVVIAPYDVRQSKFIGGGVNAVTKSGTNKFQASAFAYHRNEYMRGDHVSGQTISGAREKDRNTTFGFTFGGPIVKNKLFFFTNFEMDLKPTVINRWQASDNGVADASAYISRTTKEDMQKVSEYLKENYGYDTGSYTDFSANTSNIKALARIDWNITDKHHLALRYNYTLNQAWNNVNPMSSNCGQRVTNARTSEYSMAFSNSMYSVNNSVHSVVLDLNSNINDCMSNQFLATFSQLDDSRGSNSSQFPFVDILDGSGDIKPYMSLGYELFSYNNTVHNTVLNFKDDFTITVDDHKIIAGLGYEYQVADNSYMRNGTGYYRYNSLDDFLNKKAPETVALTYGYGTDNPAARVRYHRVSVYAQDEWNINPTFKLTYGLRLETIAFSDKDLMTNKAILDLSRETYGVTIDTGAWPTPKLLANPRVGFTWNILGNQSLIFRGGTGIFTGRLPLVFFTNMPTNSGMIQNVTSATTYYDNGKPTSKTDSKILNAFEGKFFTDATQLRDYLNSLDPARYPLTISPDEGSVPSYICAVDPNFMMPQVWKTSLALDYVFPTSFPMSLSVEGIFNKAINAAYIQDVNLKSPEGFARLNNGADNRHIFPTDYKYCKTSAYVLTNTNQGYGWDASATFRITPCKNLNITATYAHVVSKELTGMPGSDASSAFTYIPTVEGPNNPYLHNSQYVTPDRVTVNLTYSDPGNNHYTLFYEGWLGGYNYSYMYENDLNGDNYKYDALYIPATKDECAFKTEADRDRFWAYVQNDPYLSAHKGQYAEAYSVYSPWTNRLDFRYAHDFKINCGKGNLSIIQINFDIKNLLNLFCNDWGVSKYMNPDLNSGRILKVEEIKSDGTPVFSTPASVSGTTATWVPYKDISQCWYAQIGIKFMFN